MINMFLYELLNHQCTGSHQGNRTFPSLVSPQTPNHHRNGHHFRSCIGKLPNRAVCLCNSSPDKCLRWAAVPDPVHDVHFCHFELQSIPKWHYHYELHYWGQNCTKRFEISMPYSNWILCHYSLSSLPFLLIPFRHVYRAWKIPKSTIFEPVFLKLKRVSFSDPLLPSLVSFWTGWRGNLTDIA